MNVKLNLTAAKPVPLNHLCPDDLFIYDDSPTRVYRCSFRSTLAMGVRELITNKLTKMPYDTLVHRVAVAGATLDLEILPCN